MGCGNHFKPKRSTAMFCCSNCRLASWRAREDRRSAPKKSAATDQTQMLRPNLSVLAVFREVVQELVREHHSIISQRDLEFLAASEEIAERLFAISSVGLSGEQRISEWESQEREAKEAVAFLMGAQTKRGAD